MRTRWLSLTKKADAIYCPRAPLPPCPSGNFKDELTNTGLATLARQSRGRSQTAPAAATSITCWPAANHAAAQKRAALCGRRQRAGSGQGPEKIASPRPHWADSSSATESWKPSADSKRAFPKACSACVATTSVSSPRPIQLSVERRQIQSCPGPRRRLLAPQQPGRLVRSGVLGNLHSAHRGREGLPRPQKRVAVTADLASLLRPHPGSHLCVRLGLHAVWKTLDHLAKRAGLMTLIHKQDEDHGNATAQSRPMTPEVILRELAPVQLGDIHLETTDHRQLVLRPCRPPSRRSQTHPGRSGLKNARTLETRPRFVVETDPAHAPKNQGKPPAVHHLFTIHCATWARR